MLHSRFVVPGRSTAHVAFTDRHGGYSSGDFSSFNLARHVGDDEELVAANRSALAQVLGLSAERLSFVSQVHGTAVHHVTDTAAIRAGAEADAQVSALAGVGLVIMVADCTPILLADTEAGVIGAVHAGRPGMAAGIVPETLAAMRDLGAREIHAVIGPSVCPRCYEVPASLRDEVAAVEPVAASVSVSGTPALDVAGAVAEQLRREGAVIDHFSRTCSRESEDLYSYRRSRRTGRFAGVVWLQ
ncbi:peptidoglycan editing factor PgeF [Brevibacterium casei]|uniref:Purine nucleoside phosphorylase n=2 Tax=Brevibacterium casei TaxID=33889 RepID=A0A269Z9L1_9MICO|nr:peptidoglycan editing factor PgeF [Brevibacterium casei]MCT1551498.1 peptidoglycan editing factor PgeF [Brevibacterium casei]MCT1560935.1 peptidoglycan editing factor PgeF [Brevibacterium casei]MCT2209257.1 peptidoglycan editing factor PgeF [Brevibacterium casei]PAK94230.1 laccase [Brevibacterium casei]QPR40731.1 peptidoglycan editing factor PgeF [Brevibacterium casei]